MLRPTGANEPADAWVRPAVPGDLDALLQIEDGAFASDRLTRRDLRHAIGSPSILSLVADGPEGVVGYVLVETRRGTRIGRLSSIAVARDAAGSGVGHRLTEAAERTALARGCDRMRLEVRADNARAVTLYERLGYRATGREDDYYEDGGAALMFEKRLSSP